MKEQLSALIDGEIDIENASYLLLGAKSDGELKQVWVTYHLIGDVMRGDTMHRASMADRVMDVLVHEPTVLAPQSAREHNAPLTAKRVYSRSMIWSVAASVAAVMFVGMMLLQHNALDQNTGSPIQIADALPAEYLVAHQIYAPNSAAYYIQNAAYNEQR